MTKMFGGGIVAALGFNMLPMARHSRYMVGRLTMRCQYQKAAVTISVIFSHFIGETIEGKGTIIRPGTALCKFKKHF